MKAQEYSNAMQKVVDALNDMSNQAQWEERIFRALATMLCLFYQEFTEVAQSRSHGSGRIRNNEVIFSPRSLNGVIREFDQKYRAMLTLIRNIKIEEHRGIPSLDSTMPEEFNDLLDIISPQTNRTIGLEKKASLTPLRTKLKQYIEAVLRRAEAEAIAK